MSIAVLSLIATAAPAFSNGISQCRDISTQWQCVGGIPKLIFNAPADVQTSFTVASSAPGGAFGDKLITLSGSKTELPLSTAVETGFSLAVMGTPEPGGREGACCFSTLHVGPTPDDICDEPTIPAGGGATSASPDTGTGTAPSKGKVDHVISATLDPVCPLAAAGNSCTATVSLKRLGPPDQNALPINIKVTGAKISSLTLSSPFACFNVGRSALVCQIPDAALGETDLILPLRIETTQSTKTRTLTLCAEFGPPADPAAQIAVVQSALAALGHNPGPIDGSPGPKTRTAVAEFAARFGLNLSDPTAPKVHELLGLGPHIDANPTNNKSCVAAQVEPMPLPACDRATAVLKGDRCQCRFARMIENSDGASCRCVKGTRFEAGAGCLSTRAPRNDTPPPPSPPICDAATTVQRGNSCICRYSGMVPISRTKCICLAGAIPGVEGCK